MQPFPITLLGDTSLRLLDAACNWYVSFAHDHDHLERARVCEIFTRYITACMNMFKPRPLGLRVFHAPFAGGLHWFEAKESRVGRLVEARPPKESQHQD